MPAAAATATVAAAVVVLGRLGSATSSPPALGERKESEAAIEALSLSPLYNVESVGAARGWPCNGGDGGGVLLHCTVGRLVGLSAWPAS